MIAHAGISVITKNGEQNLTLQKAAQIREAMNKSAKTKTTDWIDGQIIRGDRSLQGLDHKIEEGTPEIYMGRD